MNQDGKKRRELIRMAGMATGGAMLWNCGGLALEAGGAARREFPPAGEQDVSPAEDLMREHGLLNRVLLIYEEGSWRLESRLELKPEVLARAAGLIRRFMEDYHEKLEEEHLFPRFEQAGLYVDLVRTLRAQHQAGRRLTNEIERLAKLPSLKNSGDRRRLSELLRTFIRMYRPHEAREDTVLFPAFRKIMTPQEYDALGDKFEDKEHELFGADGFEKNVEEVATLERQMGIYDLALFTPKP